MVNEPLLKQMLASPDFHARAAATRVLCYWRDRVGNPLVLLEERVNDDNPRVRLEALRALSFFDDSKAPKALEVATQSLDLSAGRLLEVRLARDDEHAGSPREGQEIESGTNENRQAPPNFSRERVRRGCDRQRVTLNER